MDRTRTPEVLLSKIGEHARGLIEAYQALARMGFSAEECAAAGAAEYLADIEELQDAVQAIEEIAAEVDRT